ncbi:hypothetical protein Micbo1qcDRAFT_168481 [Microdochium bolleyi]|uniref:Uncharacterized protein n=1 Tax=Microdochium bolleyi TaxID=196109 RepID=A0A136INH3_9PEZI|nr:hypothetical protein Micbo1qcDRAFT_168481 [Microdochium bolleyi]
MLQATFRGHHPGFAVTWAGPVLWTTVLLEVSFRPALNLMERVKARLSGQSGPRGWLWYTDLLGDRSDKGGMPKNTAIVGRFGTDQSTSTAQM